MAAVLSLFAATALAFAPDGASGDSTASFSADYSSTTGTTISQSQLLNGSEGGYLTMQNLHWFSEETGQLSSLGLQSIRVDHIFDDTFYHLVNADSSGTITYNFSYLDKQILPMLKSGMTPFVSLSDMSAVLGSNVNGPPTSDTAWGAAVSAVVTHYVNLGYTGWDWEVWNEPDLSGSFTGTEAQYEAMYAAAASAVKSADSTAQVGGPAVFNLSDSWTNTFLSYLQANPSTPFNFLSYHSYNTTNFSSSTTAQTDLTTYGFGSVPIYVTEWNNSTSMTEGSGSGSDTNSSEGGASYAAARLYTASGPKPARCSGSHRSTGTPPPTRSTATWAWPPRTATARPRATCSGCTPSSPRPS